MRYLMAAALLTVLFPIPAPGQEEKILMKALTEEVSTDGESVNARIVFSYHGSSTRKVAVKLRGLDKWTHCSVSVSGQKPLFAIAHDQENTKTAELTSGQFLVVAVAKGTAGNPQPQDSAKCQYTLVASEQ